MVDFPIAMFDSLVPLACPTAVQWLSNGDEASPHGAGLRHGTTWDCLHDIYIYIEIGPYVSLTCKLYIYYRLSYSM